MAAEAGSTFGWRRGGLFGGAFQALAFLEAGFGSLWLFVCATRNLVWPCFLQFSLLRVPLISKGF